MAHGPISRRLRRNRGYILVATALSIPFLLGVSGLAIDIGRMYITKTEAQAFVDSASLVAARAGRHRSGGDPRDHSGDWRQRPLALRHAALLVGGREFLDV